MEGNQEETKEKWKLPCSIHDSSEAVLFVQNLINTIFDFVFCVPFSKMAEAYFKNEIQAKHL